MHRKPLLEMLKKHQALNSLEAQMCASLIAFVEKYPGCFDRSLLCGHVTGSAWIVDKDRTHVLLTHHTKLDRWFQLGGHADGDPDILRVALREATEESGLKEVLPVTEKIFDVDIHEIPATAKEPAHFHYDVRMLLEADRDAPLVVSSESKDLVWVKLENIPEYSTEESLARMSTKTLALQH